MKTLKIVALAAACSLAAACATGYSVVQTKDTLTGLNKAWTAICGTLAADHAAGKVTGKKFNDKRENCLAADTALTLGDIGAAAAALAAADK